MSFLNNLIFPTAISVPYQGGPQWAAVTVIETDSGFESRNNPWSYPKHWYDIGYGIKDISDLEDVRDIFNVAQGMTNSFRFLDAFDYKSCARDSDVSIDDQTLISSAAGGETTAQLIKVYSRNGYSLTRKIECPYNEVLVKVNTTALTQDTHFTVNTQTGVIDFTGGTSPHGALTASDAVYAGFYFHVPVRFDTNRFPLTLETRNYGSLQIPLVEDRLTQ